MNRNSCLVSAVLLCFSFFVHSAEDALVQEYLRTNQLSRGLVLKAFLLNMSEKMKDPNGSLNHNAVISLVTTPLSDDAQQLPFIIEGLKSPRKKVFFSLAQDIQDLYSKANASNFTDTESTNLLLTKLS